MNSDAAPVGVVLVVCIRIHLEKHHDGHWKQSLADVHRPVIEAGQRSHQGRCLRSVSLVSRGIQIIEEPVHESLSPERRGTSQLLTD